MDFTKFVSMLSSSSLYFSRADRLGDRFEGSMPKGNISHRPEIYSTIPEAQREYVITETVRFRQRLILNTYINCWHMNMHESAAMWRLYSSSNASVALLSKYSRLVDVLDKETYVGVVRYIDYEHALIPENNILWPFMFKRMSFSHECEIRAVIMDMPPKSSQTDGLHKQVKLADLVEKVYISPEAPKWYFELVSSVVKRFGLDLEILQSSLSAEPIY